MSEQEAKISLMFKNIEAEFAAHDKINDVVKAESKLAHITEMIRDVKGCAPAQTGTDRLGAPGDVYCPAG